MFRGSILIAEKILSYSDFVNMPYDKFCKVEATYHFMMNLKNKGISGTQNNTTNEKKELKNKLSGLPTIDPDLLTEDERNFLNGSN